ncbi:hypothetical protein GCM10008986_30140 [Salinibacillus aidingensis]|uniref:Uncharacterized protein n=1 Tax=Salinibacillus aidingensis TaxID=237684 RepID=A0ABN1BMU1_9BACI
MRLVIVEVCDGNLMARVDLEEIIEHEYPEAAVIENSCLNFCGMCAKRPYAMVNGHRVFGQTAEECLDKIRTKIEEELAVFH